MGVPLMQTMGCFFLVFARDKKHVSDKIKELSSLGMPFLVICGEKLDDPRVVYRKARGKYDAINFGLKLLPKETGIVALNDVDTRIHNFDHALNQIRSGKASLVFVRTVVMGGPQVKFYTFEDAIRKHILIAADGGLMLIRLKALREILPLKPCKAEDTYILFLLLQRKEQVHFCRDSYVETEMTKTQEKEEEYKRKVVAGIYQALAYTTPSLSIRLFYSLLPLASPLLLVLGKKGYYWMRGILLGLLDYLRGDRSGIWQTTYMD